MPLTHHFKPFPKAGEPHFEIQSEYSTQPELNVTPCACQKDKLRCRKCRQLAREDRSRSAWRRPSQTMLSPIKETPDPSRRQLTPKAMRDKRRASSRMSASSAFDSAVGTEEYFPLFHSRAFARSESASSPSSRSRSGRRHGSGSSSSQSRSPSSDQAPSPLALDSVDSVLQEEGKDVLNDKEMPVDTL